MFYALNIQNDVQDVREYWKEKNSLETEKLCTELLQKLEQEYFNPIPVRLETNASDLTAADITLAYDSIYQSYQAHARGAKSVRAQVFTNFYPVCINNMMLTVVLFSGHKVNSMLGNHVKHIFYVTGNLYLLLSFFNYLYLL